MDTKALVEQFARDFTEATQGELASLREDLDLVNQQYAQLKAEDQGWLMLFGAAQEGDTGLELDTLKEVSKRLKESVAGSPLPKQANALRYSYTFSQPFIIPETEGSTEVKRGRPSKKNLFFENPVNQRYVFGKEAQQLISTACSTDGMYLALLETSTNSVRPIPLHEIVGLQTSPDFVDEVWAYQRQWSVPGEKNPRRFWYYTDRFPGVREKSLPSAVGTEDFQVPVAQGFTLIDLVVNQQVGWPLGVPDLMAGEVWNKKYITMMNHGEEVSATLAYYAAKVRTKSKAGATATGVKLGSKGGAGKTIAHGEGNEVDVFSSAGRVYSFSDLNPIAGMYAAAAGVSLVDLLSSPSASGSSYGAAKALDSPTRRAIESRRLQVAAWLERVIKAATGNAVQVTPASIEEVDLYRRSQILALAWNSGLVHEDEARAEYLYLAGITPKRPEAPAGVMLPNNEKSLKRKDIDTDSAGQNPTTSSPGQGQSSGDGGAGSTAANDMRDDTLT